MNARRATCAIYYGMPKQHKAPACRLRARANLTRPPDQDTSSLKGFLGQLDWNNMLWQMRYLLDPLDNRRRRHCLNDTPVFMELIDRVMRDIRRHWVSLAGCPRGPPSNQGKNEARNHCANRVPKLPFAGIIPPSFQRSGGVERSLNQSQRLVQRYIGSHCRKHHAKNIQKASQSEADRGQPLPVLPGKQCRESQEHGSTEESWREQQLRTLAFMACMATMATFGSAASSPHMVEQTQAKKKPNIAPCENERQKG